MRDRLVKILDNSMAEDASYKVLSFYEYLDLIVKKPWVTRDTFQLLHDMILSRGVEHSLTAGKPVKHRYSFFEDTEMVGPFIVFGQQKAKENVVEKIDNASRGLEASKRLWILLGPPGSAKSRSMDGIKTALNLYSRSEAGLTYTLLLPTVDERLKDRALFEEDGVYYLQSPLCERPLQLIPHQTRTAFCEELNASVDNETMSKFLQEHPHYDNVFKINVSGNMSPYSQYIIEDFMKTKGISFTEMLDYIKEIGRASCRERV